MTGSCSACGAEIQACQAYEPLKTDQSRDPTVFSEQQALADIDINIILRLVTADRIDFVRNILLK